MEEQSEVPSTQESETPTETLMKPKRTRIVTEDQRKALAENMRRVNQARIEKAKIANEKILQEKELKMQAKLEIIKAKKEKVRELKEKATPPAPPSTPVTTPKAPKPKVKKVIIQEDSEADSEADDEEEEEIVYVQKSKVKPKMLKEKVSQQLPAPKAIPAYVFKFV